MKVLIACEFSGIIRDAFIIKGHDAWSCDLLPTEKEGPHIQDDVLRHLDDGWDLMIAHPPCTYLSYAAMHCWNDKGRGEKRHLAMAFFMKLYDSNIEKVCIENPKGYPCQAFRKPDQIIQPYYFGEPHQKTTCLWLKNLLPLEFHIEDDLFGNKTACNKPEPIYRDKTTGHRRYFTDAHHGDHIRSKSFSSIAQTMADQWG
jgi:hypothetical protein